MGTAQFWNTRQSSGSAIATPSGPRRRQTHRIGFAAFVPSLNQRAWPARARNKRDRSALSTMTLKHQKAVSSDLPLIPEDRLQELMSELISLREKVAQAELAAGGYAIKGNGANKSARSPVKRPKPSS